MQKQKMESVFLCDYTVKTFDCFFKVYCLMQRKKIDTKKHLKFLVINPLEIRIEYILNKHQICSCS